MPHIILNTLIIVTHLIFIITLSATYYYSYHYLHCTNEETEAREVRLSKLSKLIQLLSGEAKIYTIMHSFNHSGYRLSAENIFERNLTVWGLL